MPSHHLLYGHRQIPLPLPDGCQADWIEPGYTPPASNADAVVREAIAHPVDGANLRIFAGAKQVAIAINDKTRPVPHDVLLPPLLDALHAVGISPEAVTFYIATGTHLPMPPEEFRRVLPEEIVARYKVESHNCDDESNLVSLGMTQRGTPVFANRRFTESDLKIVVGNIEPHHFAGFSGGYKTASIGLGGRQTINANHIMLIEPGARIANFEGNPLREDLDEAGDLIGVDFALNAVLNNDLKIVHALFGAPRAVELAGIPLSRAVCQLPPSGKPPYDLVIASAGGMPKDINFYQAQKALTHASLFVREGGAIVLAAACLEGSGSASYEAFMQDVDSIPGVFEKTRRVGFRVGPHKALQVARLAEKANLIILSEMEPALVRKLLMTPAANMDEALACAMKKLAAARLEDLRIAVLPHATHTIPG